jgi:polysaccharide biosynthesis transport protein
VNDSIDAIRYIGYLRARWRGIAVSAGIAAGVALAVSLAMPRQYTAAARVVIDPPAGMDPRSSIAVSPIYLESLKTYEHFAASDSLFQRAAEKFGLPRHPMEAVKRRVLKVQIVRNTRILEIAATLPEPVKAQALAKYIADSTVEMNRTNVLEGDQDLVRNLEQQQRDVRTQLEATQAAWSRAVANEPVESLHAAMETDGELRSRVQQQAQSVELEIADIAERAKQNGPDAAELRREDANARVRLAAMRKQLADLDRSINEREKLLAARQTRRDQLEAERKAGQAALVGVETRLREARSDSGLRGERLRVIDPGVVPERPSSPNVPLNVMAALLAGVVLPVLYLTLALHYEDSRAGSRRTVFRAVAKARDE